MKANDAEVTIEEVGVRGDGIARVEGQLVFVPYTLPGERVRVRLGKPRKEGIRASLKAVLEPAPERADPPCRHFGTCGGCMLQHMADDAYARWKTGTVLGALRRQDLPMDVVEPLVRTPPHARRRADFTAVRRKDDVLLGFNALREHRVVDVAECPIMLPAIVDLVPAMREALLRLLRPGDTAEVVVNALDGGLDVLLVTAARVGSGGRERLAVLAEETDLARLSLRHPQAPTPETVAERKPPIVTFGGHAVTPPPGAFLQASAAGEDALAGFVVREAGTGRVADLYCGIGTFALPLAARGARVLAVDGDRASVAALEAAANRAALNTLSVQARHLGRRPLTVDELNRFDAAVFDPPRAGARALAETMAASRLPRIVGVSCNPASFARDARVLTEGGYRLRRVLPVDQFLWSPHVELAALFELD